MHAGVTSEALLRELRAGLEALASAVPPGCPSPPLLAHGHYPLSTVDFPTHEPGPLGMLRHMARSVRSMQVGGAAHSKVPTVSEQRKPIKRIACAAWQLADCGPKQLACCSCPCACLFGNAIGYLPCRAWASCWLTTMCRPT